MANVIYVAGFYGNGNPTGAHTRTAKVWKFTGSSLIDISTGLGGDEAVCLAADSTDGILYAGCDDGKIYKYTGTSWSVEYDTGDSTRSIVSLVYNSGKWWALASGQPRVESSPPACVVWRRDGAGNWTITKAANATPNRSATCMEVLTGNDGTYFLINAHNPGQMYYSSDGANFTVNGSLSQSGDPLGHPVIQEDAGTPYYVINNCDTGNSWRNTAINGNFGASGLGRPGSPLINGLNQGPHATITYKGQYYIMDHQYNRVYSLVLGAGWSAVQVDLPFGSLVYEFRSGFAEHDDGDLYAIAEAWKGSDPWYNSFIYSTPTGAPGVTGTSAWTADYQAAGITGRTGGDNFLDILSAEEFTMPLQFRRNQIKNGEIIQAHHEDMLSHVVRVDYSMVVTDHRSRPPSNSVSAGDEFITGPTTGGQWAGFSSNIVVEALIDNPSATGDWTRIGALGSGDLARISDAPSPTGSFAGETSNIAQYDGSAWKFLGPRDGFQCVQPTATTSKWFKDTFIWNADTSTWTEIGTALSIDPNDNALELTDNEIGHVDQMGHNFTPVKFANVYSDLDYNATTPTYSSHSGEVWIVNNWGNLFTVDGEVVVAGPNGWESVSGTGAEILGSSDAISTASTVGAGAGFTANKFAIYSDAAFPNGTWTEITPNKGDQIHVDDSEERPTAYLFDSMTAVWNGTQWVPVAIWPSEWVGDYLEFDSSYNVNVLLSANGGLQTDGSNAIRVGPTASGTVVSASNKVADQLYVQQYLQGFDWQASALVLKVVDDLHVTAPSAPLLNTYDSYVVGSGVQNTWSMFTFMDLVQWSGSTFVKIKSLTDGDRFIIRPTTPTGSFSQHGNDIATVTNSASYVFTSPTDTWALMLGGENGGRENTQWVYDSDPGVWVQVGAQAVYSASGGVYINTTNNKIMLDHVRNFNVPTSGASGHSFTGLDYRGGSIISGWVGVYRNGQRLQQVAANPAIGQYTWNNANERISVDANDEFRTGEVLEFVGYAKP